MTSRQYPPQKPWKTLIVGNSPRTPMSTRRLHTSSAPSAVCPWRCPPVFQKRRTPSHLMSWRWSTLSLKAGCFSSRNRNANFSPQPASLMNSCSKQTWPFMRKFSPSRAPPRIFSGNAGSIAHRFLVQQSGSIDSFRSFHLTRWRTFPAAHRHLQRRVPRKPPSMRTSTPHVV